MLMLIIVEVKLIKLLIYYIQNRKKTPPLNKKFFMFIVFINY